MDDVVDRDAHVRAARRRQALDALSFEQDREAMLVEQLEDVLAEAGGKLLDDRLFARMSPGDADLVRGALGEVVADEPDEEVDADDDTFDFSLDLEDDDAAAGETDEAAEVEEETARLRAEIESSRRTQAALAQYLDLLSVLSAG